MREYCCVCGAEIEVPIEDFLEVEEEIDDYFCDDCAEAAMEWITQRN